ncbi:MAG: nuclear transport factor 2 family protein, partial [candidate division Zixibacteria bacterium]|nr:nuclear transport factor 2 family protein [candidate division Zixibacteria bacterium]
MKYMKPFIVLTIFSFIGGCAMSPEIDYEAEKAKVEEAVRASIEWACPDKDTERLYGAIAKDPSFFIFHPDSASTIKGFEAFRQMTESFFMRDDFHATSSDIRDLRINLSRSGDVAWFSAILDDRGNFQGRPYAWLNTRWTGVLEKQEGAWLIKQMHFSFASD